MVAALCRRIIDLFSIPRGDNLCSNPFSAVGCSSLDEVYQELSLADAVGCSPAKRVVFGFVGTTDGREWEERRSGGWPANDEEAADDDEGKVGKEETIPLFIPLRTAIKLFPGNSVLAILAILVVLPIIEG